MLSTMASFGAGRDSPSPMPLALTLTPGDARGYAVHHSSFHHHPHSLLHHHAASFPDPIRRLALARLPPPRRPTSGANSKPFTSFCIRDILGREADREGDSSSSSRHSDASSVSSSKKLAGTVSSARGVTGNSVSSDSVGRGRAPSRSPTTPTPTGPSNSCTTSPKTPAAVPSVSVNGARIVRPWAPSPSSPDTEISSDDGIDNCHDSALDNDEEDDEEISVDDDEPSPRPRSSKGGKSGVSPLDALMAMTSKTFEGLDTPDSADARRRDQAALFGKHAPPKKRRKSRTAFTNQQIYELEKRFLYQKYLTPADRDEIAHTLGLSNAQVITWFQNRRAKLKRDLEELKNDVTAAKKHPVHKTLMGTVAEMQLRRVHEEVLKKAAAEARKAERDRERERAGTAAPSPPSSPSSSASAAGGGRNSCSPSPSLPPLAASGRALSPSGGALSPSGSCHSNASGSSVGGMNNVCSLVASNNNHNHGGHDLSLRGRASDNDASSVDNDDDAVAAEEASRTSARDGDANKVKDGERSSAERGPSLPPSPRCRSEERVSPAASPVVTVHVKHGEENEVSAEHGAEVISEEEEMDTSEEPENLSLKSANS